MIPLLISQNVAHTADTQMVPILVLRGARQSSSSKQRNVFRNTSQTKFLLCIYSITSKNVGKKSKDSYNLQHPCYGEMLTKKVS